MTNNLSLLHLKNILKPMGKVTSIIQDKYILFQKDNTIFCKMSSKKLYLMDQYRSFKIVRSSLFNNPDQLLREATTSFYFAAGYKKFGN